MDFALHQFLSQILISNKINVPHLTTLISGIAHISLGIFSAEIADK
jgi:hypothetical protein